MDHLLADSLHKHLILPPLLLLLLGLITCLKTLFRKRHGKTIVKDGRCYDLPPMVPLSTRETIKAFQQSDYLFKLMQWTTSYGPIYQVRLPSPHSRVVIVSDATVYRNVLSSPTRPKEFKTYRSNHDGGSDLFSSNDDFWKHSRKAISQAFSSKHIRRMNCVVVQKTNEKLIPLLDKCAANGDLLTESKGDGKLYVVCATKSDDAKCHNKSYP
mmetsp:Transcript_3235/g.4307  ORF Transcript_3235/g.4307 Transcript_3235/m.4307 type:complete len:213 (-) Transcript_3235:1156-1794(-)